MSSSSGFPNIMEILRYPDDPTSHGCLKKQPWGMYHALDQPLNFVDGYPWLFLKRCWSDPSHHHAGLMDSIVTPPEPERNVAGDQRVNKELYRLTLWFRIRT